MKKIAGVLLVVIGIGIAALGVSALAGWHEAVSAVGGTDGPVVLFWSQVGNAPAWIGVIAGAAIFVVALFLLIRKK